MKAERTQEPGNFNNATGQPMIPLMGVASGDCCQSCTSPSLPLEGKNCSPAAARAGAAMMNPPGDIVHPAKQSRLQLERLGEGEGRERGMKEMKEGAHPWRQRRARPR
jgi:hypothetical protein